MLRRKTATYALLALYEIGRQNREASGGKGVRAADIAEKHSLPKAYAAKILSQLANAGILHSDRGPKGGFRLNQSPQSISLYDVFDGAGALVAFEKKGQPVKGLPPKVQRVMNKALGDATSRLEDLFKQVHLGDLLSPNADG